MMTPFESVVRDSSKDHTVTAPTSYDAADHRAGYTTMRDSTARSAPMLRRGPRRHMAGPSRSTAERGWEPSLARARSSYISQARYVMEPRPKHAGGGFLTRAETVGVSAISL